jgi:hypothetical protein
MSPQAKIAKLIHIWFMYDSNMLRTMQKKADIKIRKRLEY